MHGLAHRSSFPVALVLLVLLFLAAQDSVDRRDPKLALSPLRPEADVEFEPQPQKAAVPALPTDPDRREAS